MTTSHLAFQIGLTIGAVSYMTRLLAGPESLAPAARLGVAFGLAFWGWALLFFVAEHMPRTFLEALLGLPLPQ